MVEDSSISSCIRRARSQDGRRIQLHGECATSSSEIPHSSIPLQTYTMFDQIFWRATSGQVNRWRKKTLGLGSTNLEAMQQHKIPFLYNFR